MPGSSETGGTSKEVLSFEFRVLSYPKTSNLGPRIVIRCTSSASLARAVLLEVSREYCGLAFCEVDGGGAWWSSMANDLTLHEIDHQLGDIGGMIGHPFKIFGNEAQTNSA